MVQTVWKFREAFALDIRVNTGDGTVDRDELEKALKKLGFYHLSGAQIDAIMKRADSDENCVIDYDEFVKEAPKTLKTNLVKLAKNNGAELGFLS